MGSLTREEFDRLVKSRDLETYTVKQFAGFIEANEELLIKGESGQELDDIQKSELDELREEIRSFVRMEIYDTKEGTKNTIVKSVMFIRDKQVDWSDEIIKSEDGEEETIRKGIYTDTPLNRKIGRIGQKYGGKKEDETKEDKKT